MEIQEEINCISYIKTHTELFFSTANGKVFNQKSGSLIMFPLFAANWPPVSLIPVASCHRCRWHQRQMTLMLFSGAWGEDDSWKKTLKQKISVEDPGCLSPIRIFSIPDPNLFHPWSRIRHKEFKYFNPKKWFLSTHNYDPGFSSWIRIPDPGFNPGSRIRIPDPDP
jgi:hypothetical protein